MILYIDTVGENIQIAIKKDGEVLFSSVIEAKYAQAEKLLPGIDAILTQAEIKISDIEEIEVNNFGGSFTSLRIGVITANALGYALKIPVKAIGKQSEKQTDLDFDVVEPAYDREPNITISKKEPFVD